MEESATTTNESWAGQFACALGEHRGRVQQFLAEQRSRLKKAQAELAEQADRLEGAIRQDQGQTAQAEEEFRCRSELLARQADNLARLQEEIQSRQAEWDQAQQRVTQHLNHLAEQVRREQAELVQRREELELRQAELDAAAAKLHHDQQSFTLEREEHAAQVEHVAGLRQCLEANLAAMESLRVQYEHAQRQAASAAGEANRVELEALRAERDGLAQRLSETEQRLTPLVAQLSDAEEQLERLRNAAKDADADDFRRRYEMALEDVRDLKVRNQELERQLVRAREGAKPAASPPAQRLDWELEKSRILAALESACDDENEDEEQRGERLKIEEVVRQTDKIVAEKDREILELRQLLKDQSSNLGAVAVGAAALGEILDKDAIIQEERANLRRLQAEWEEKMRQAEIEISVERAKIARQRAEIEGQLHAMDPDAGQSQSEKAAAAKPARGRWLNRLGLAGPDKE